jgi:nucleotide-binding universal stress UspA family protein
MPEMKVLIPLDGSPLAEIALGALESIEALGPLRIKLVSVVEAIEGMSEVARDEYLKREEHLLRAYLEGAAARINSERKVASLDSVVMAGRPLEIILDQARDFAPDLLLISSHGRSGLSRWRLGSVADGIVRSQTANTLVVGPNGRLRAPMQSVLVGLDGSGLAESALPTATALAASFGATLHLVRVISLPFSASEEYQVYLDDLTAHARSYLEEVRAKLSFSGKVELAARVGAPADRLIDYAAAHDINLAVISSHGRGGIARAALGSVAGRLVGGPVPVLIVRHASSSS